jgi:MFS family permease
MSTAGLSSPAARQGIRTFYTLILTQTLSMIGSSVTSLAIGIWVFNQTGNATPLAMVSFFAAIPMTIAASVSGVLADRWDRRYVMAVADAGQAAGTCILLASFVTGSFQLWHLYAVTLVSSVFGAFQRPAFQASVTMLVPDEQRDRANAIQQIIGSTGDGVCAVAASAVCQCAIFLVDAGEDSARSPGMRVCGLGSDCDVADAARLSAGWAVSRSRI